VLCHLCWVASAFAKMAVVLANERLNKDEALLRTESCG